MNYNMYTNRPNDNIDPNYIYPRPYIDPMMYVNPYMPYGSQFSNYQMDPKMTNYPTYTNTFTENPPNPDLTQIDDNSVYPTIEDGDPIGIDPFYPTQPNMNGYPNTNNPGMNSNMPSMNMNTPGMNSNPQDTTMSYPPGMFPGMSPGMMYPPGMFPGMFPNMMYPPSMFPGMFPNMMYPPGMFPGMFPNMPPINMEEFDEEEM